MTDTYDRLVSVQNMKSTYVRTAGAFSNASHSDMAPSPMANFTTLVGGFGIEKYPFMIYGCGSYEQVESTRLVLPSLTMYVPA
jgi:hypothetical protein